MRQLLDLAHEDLPSLSLRDYQGSIYDSQSLRKLASLTELTRLELKALTTDNEEEVGALRYLQLQELVLINCPDLEWRLFVPGALTRLRKLHIENEDCIAIGNYRMRNSLLLDKKREQLKAAGEIVFQLGELSQISGLCNLFVAGMRQGLGEWDVAALPEGTMVSDTATHCCPINLMKIWSKPVS